MKKTLYLTLVAMFLVACQKNDEEKLNEQQFEIRATIENTELTKVSLDFGYTPLINVWNYGDKLYIAKPNASEYGSNRTFDWDEFTISNIAGQNDTVQVGIFKGENVPQLINVKPGDTSNQKYLAIAAPSAPTNGGGCFYINLPNNQIYKENSINPGYLVMSSLSDDYLNMSFRSMVSILRVKVKDSSNSGEHIKSIVLDPGIVDGTDPNDNGKYHRGFAGKTYVWITMPQTARLGTIGIQAYANQSRSDGTLTLNCEPDGIGTGPLITSFEKDFYLVIVTTDGDTTPYGYSITVNTSGSTKTIGPVKKHFVINPGKIYTTSIDIHPLQTTNTVANINGIENEEVGNIWK